MRRAFAIGIVALGLTLAVPAAAHAQASKDQPVLISADRVSYDQDNGVVSASGHVELSQTSMKMRGGQSVQEEQILLADSVTYNERTNVVAASGHVSLLDPSGNVVFAQYVQLSNDMKDGVIRDLRMRLPDNSRMAAAGGNRRGGVVTEMNKAVYSPCEICEGKPDRAPLWQLRADKVVHNQNTHDIKYYNAFLDIYGFPVLYTPYLSHPDPTVKRRTGLLAPTYGSSSQLGFMFGLPYYIVVDQSEDILLRPIVTENQGAVFSGQYRKRFLHGDLDLSGSITEADFTNSSGTVKHDVVRGHVFGRGRFDLSDTWRTGFDLARASDDTYLSRYNFPAQNVLTTRGFLEGFSRRDYASIEAFTFQGLRPTDNANTTPLIAPLVTYNYFGEPNSRGAYFTFDTNFLSLTRHIGVDSHRLSLRGGWHLPYVADHGDVFEASITTQADAYYVDNVPDPSRSGGTFKGVTGRFFPQLALSWRYPLVRAYKTQRQLIEPIAAIVVGPNGSNPNMIPNEDSQSFEFDDSDLFKLSRFPGLDRVEGGQRIDFGFNTGLYGKDGGSVTAFLGESYRLHRSSAFTTGSGLEDRLSDIVGRIHFIPSGYYDILYRFRLDKDTLRPRRNEITLNVGPPLLHFTGDYIFLSEETGIGGFAEREEVSGQLTSKLNDYWTVGTQTVQNLSGGGTLGYQFDATYEDECFSLIGSFIRREYTDREIRPSNTILFRLVFRHLGELRT